MKLMILLIFVLAACAPAAPEPTAEEAIAEPTTEATVATVTEEAAAETEAPAEMEAEDAEAAAPQAENVAYSGPAWTQIELVNARTGETFTFADFAGRTVYVHAMADWCTSCRASQRSLSSEVVPVVPDGEAVFVSLEIQTNSTPDVLAAYANNNDFNWTFAVATPELLQALAADLGSQINVAPSTPHFYIGENGEVSDLFLGTYTSDNKLELLREFGATF